MTCRRTMQHCATSSAATLRRSPRPLTTFMASCSAHIMPTSTVSYPSCSIVRVLPPETNLALCIIYLIGSSQCRIRSCPWLAYQFFLESHIVTACNTVGLHEHHTPSAPNANGHAVGVSAAGLLAAARQKKQELVNSLKWRRRPEQPPTDNIWRQSNFGRQSSIASRANRTSAGAGQAPIVRARECTAS